MRRLLLLAAVLMSFSAFAQIDIVKTEFSTDDGKTWSLDPPVVKISSPRFQVRVTYAGGDYRALSNGGHIGNSLRTDRDFANSPANCSAPLNELPPKAWHYLPQVPRPYIYLVDLGERPAHSGLIDAVSKKERPSCPAWKPGVYRFWIDLGYWLNDKVFKDLPVKERHVTTSETFMITLEND